MTKRFRAGAADRGVRLDHYLQSAFPEHSRSRLQQWIKDGSVFVNNRAARPSHTLREGEEIAVNSQPMTPLRASPEDIPLHILYEDDDLVAIDKPAGMVVHAGAGVRDGTLVNALLHHFDKLSKVGGDLRPGIVHRLDRFTSGVLLVAKTDAAHRSLAEQFASRRVEKTYLALVEGEVRDEQGRIEKPIARDPRRRMRMTARLGEGRAAFSEFRVLRRFARFTLLEVRIGTGRTHQIRAHLSSIGHPVAGDRLYGAAATPDARFFLHAYRIRFAQPSTNQPVEVVSPLPRELSEWMERL